MAANTSWSGQRRSFPPKVRDHILARDNHRCQLNYQYCIGTATEADHRIPHAEGGTDDPDNGQAACTVCHKHKTNQERARGKRRAKRKREAAEKQKHPGLR